MADSGASATPARACDHCGKPASSACPKCRTLSYCSVECGKTLMRLHRRRCPLLTEEGYPQRSEKYWGSWPASRTAAVVAAEAAKGKLALHDVYAAVAANRGELVKEMLTGSTKLPYLAFFDSAGRNALHVACERGHEDILALLIEHCKDKPVASAMRTKDSNEDTPLTLAIRYKRLGCINQLIAAGMGALKIKRAGGLLPLHVAAISGSLDVFTAVWIAYKSDASLGVTIDEQDGEGRTPLMFSCWGDRGLLKGELQEYILAEGASLAAKDRTGRRAVDHAAAVRAGAPAALKVLMSKGADLNPVHIRVDPSAAGKWTTYLHLAASRNITDTLQMAIKAGVPVDTVDSDGRTALMDAATWGAVETAEVLLACGAKVDHAQTENTNPGFPVTALSEAVYHGHSAVVKLLLAAGANVNKAFDQMGLHLLAACLGAHQLEVAGNLRRADQDPTSIPFTQHAKEYLAVADQLLDAGLEVCQLDAFGLNSLHATALYAPTSSEPLFDRVLAQTVEKGGVAAVNLQSKTGVMSSPFIHTGKAFTEKITPLHCAAQWGNAVRLQKLLKAGATASINTRDAEGDTALHHTVVAWLHMDPSEAVEVLLANGADKTAKNKTGNTPFAELMEFKKTMKDKRAETKLPPAKADALAIMGRKPAPKGNLKEQNFEWSNKLVQLLKNE